MGTLRQVEPMARIVVKPLVVTLCAWLWIAQPVRAADPTFVGTLATVVDESVAKRLKLSPDQKSRLSKLIDSRENEALELSLSIKDLPLDEQEAKLAPFRAESQKLGLAILDDEQRQELMRVRAEREGLEVLLEPENVQQFALTEEQQTSLRDLLSKRDAQLRKTPPQEAKAVRDEYETQLLSVLDDKQRVQWEKSAQPTPSANPAAKLLAEQNQTSGPGLLTFSFRYQPWRDVIEWFAEQADMSLIMDAPPPGTFNYQDTKSYTIAEAIDVLNEALLLKGFTLVRRGRMLILANIEDTIPDNLIPTVSEEELAQRGRNEIVSVVVRLNRLTPEEAETEIKKLLGPHGQVVVLPRLGQVKIRETGGHLKTILSVLETADSPEGMFGERTAVFELKYTSATQAIETAKQLLGIPSESNSTEDKSLRIAVDPTSTKLIFSGKPDAVSRAEQIMKVVDVGPPGSEGRREDLKIEVHPVTSADPATVLQVVSSIMAGTPELKLSTDPRTGNLIAQARPSQHETIRSVISQMQQEARTLEVIRLRKVEPQMAAIAVNKFFGGEAGGSSAPQVEADAVNRQLMVRGTTSQIEKIRGLLAQLGESQTGSDDDSGIRENVRFLPLTGRSARVALEQLETMWPTMRKNKIRTVTPSSAVSAMRNGDSPSSSYPSIVTPRRLASDGNAAPETPSADARRVTPDTRTPLTRPAPQVPLPDADDTTSNARSRVPAKFAMQQSSGDDLAPAAEEPTLEDLLNEDVPNGNVPNENMRNEESADENATTDQRAESEESEESVDGAPIIVAPSSGGVMIASEDLDALDDFEDLLSTLTSRTSSNGREYTVFYLKYGRADVIHDLIDQIFGGGGGSSGGDGGGLLGNLAGAALGDMGGLLGGGSSSGTTIYATGTVTITPDTRLNALIVQANSVDLDTIEELLSVLDQPGSPELVQLTAPPRVIPIVHTTADAVAGVVRQVYADRMGGAPAAGGGQQQQRGPNPEEFVRAIMQGAGGGRGRGGRGGGGDAARRAAEQAQKMTIGVDTRNNSLIVAAPDYLFQEVKALVEELDQPMDVESDSTTVVTLKHSNPAAVQRALKPLFGDSVKTSSTTTSSTPSTSQNQSQSNRSNDDEERNRRRAEWIQRMQQGGGSGPFGGGGGNRGGGDRGNRGGGRGGR